MSKIDRPSKRFFSNPLKRRALCIYQLSIRGSSVAAVARANGIARQTLYLVFLRPYPRMEKIIADALGLSPQVLFPNRYDADGLLNHRIGRPPQKATSKSSDSRGSCNGKKRAAA